MCQALSISQLISLFAGQISTQVFQPETEFPLERGSTGLSRVHMYANNINIIIKF